jgi:hypothetical protein
MTVTVGPLPSSQAVFNADHRRLRSFGDWLRQPENPIELERTDQQLPVLVVGAGPAGLAAMSALRRANIPFQAVESHRQVGGIWDQSNLQSSVYDSLTTNTSRYTTHLGVRVSGLWPMHPHHRAMHGYLERFAERQRVLPQIQFATLFEGAHKTNRGTWVADLRAVGEPEVWQAEFRALIVATGLHTRRNRVYPEALQQQAEADGLSVVHSCGYRNAAAYAGKRVLVVGVGVSGTAIASEVSRSARRTILASRTTPWIIPSNILGVPSDVIATSPLTWFPVWLQRYGFRTLRGLVFGATGRLSLPRPSHPFLDRFAISDNGIAQALKSKRVQVRSNVKRIEEATAFFEDLDEEPEPIDAVIFATGYRRNYPLVETMGGNSLPDSLPFLVFHRTEPGIAFMTEAIGSASCWPIFADQARAIAAYLVAEGRDRRNVRTFNARRQGPSPDFKRNWYRDADGFHIDVRTYRRSLRRLAKWLCDA